MNRSAESNPPATRPHVWGVPHRNSFTLVEMMAVTILLAVLVGTTVVRLPGIAQRERLESALANIGQFDGIARMQATADGRPRVLMLPHDESKVEILAAAAADGRISWKTSAQLRYDGHVRIIRVLLEGEAQVEAVDEIPNDEGSATDAKTSDRILIRGDGQSATYAVVCQAGEGVRGVLVIDGRTGLGRMLDVDVENRINRNLFQEDSALCD